MQTLLTEAARAIKKGDKARARSILDSLIKSDPENDMAWFYMAYVVGSKKQALACLKKATDINPMNDKAWAQLEKLEGGNTQEQKPSSNKAPAAHQDTEKTIWQANPSHYYYFGSYAIGIVGLVFWGLGLLVLLYAWLSRKNTVYTITNKRVITKTGIISRRTNEVRNTDIRSINLNQGVGERLFNLGSIQIGSAGTAGIEVFFRGVPKPTAVKKILTDLIN